MQNPIIILTSYPANPSEEASIKLLLSISETEKIFIEFALTVPSKGYFAQYFTRKTKNK
jgi:hypothetical protein